MGVTPQQFEQLKNRLNRRKSDEEPVLETRPIAAHKTVLGIDPSLRGTGYGVIQMGKPHPIALAYGTISCPSDWEHSRCLAKIGQTIREVIQNTKPTICAIEGLFFAQNLKTAIIMGEARGASMMVVAEAGLDIYEIAPRKVKQAIVGYGAAQKLAVAKMIQRMLQLDTLPDPDAADALAIALAHAQEGNRLGLARPKKI